MALNQSRNPKSIGWLIASRRTTLSMIGAGAVSALLGSLGQVPLLASSQGEEGPTADPPYVLIQRFQARGDTSTDDLLVSVESNLLSFMAQLEAFQDALIFDIGAGEIVTLCLFGAWEAANVARALGDAWRATDPNGKELVYEQQINLGGNLRYVSTLAHSDQATSTPRRSSDSGTTTPEPPYTGGPGGIYSLEAWPAETRYLDRAAIFDRAVVYDPAIFIDPAGEVEPAVVISVEEIKEFMEEAAVP